MRVLAAACLLLWLGGCGANSSGDFEAALLAAAEQAGLDIPTWQTCRGTPAPADRVAADVALGNQWGVGGTPTFFVNGTEVLGAQPVGVFESDVTAARTTAEQSGISAASYYASLSSAVPVDDSPVRGPVDAWVTIVEFGDFECPYCADAEPTLKQLLQEFGSDVRLVFKNFPLGIHAHALPAAIAAECALDQGKFWEMHDAIYANQAAIFAGDD